MSSGLNVDESAQSEMSAQSEDESARSEVESAQSEDESAPNALGWIAGNGRSGQCSNDTIEQKTWNG